MVFALVGSLHAQVTWERLLNASGEPQNWLTHSGTVLSQRYSTLSEITPDNVRNLELKWVFQARSFEKFEATPLVVDGVMYTVQPPNDIVALDAATGRVFWTYNYTPSALCTALLRTRESRCRDRRRHALHGNHRRAPDCRRCQERQAAVEQGNRQTRSGLRDHACSPCHQGQGRRRRRRRRVRHPRLHCGLQRHDRQGNVAVLYHPGQRRAGK